MCRSTRRWAAISVAAVRTCASGGRFIARARRRDMNVVKVNRREFVKITSAASAGLVLALRAHGAQGDDEYPLGAFVDVATNGIETRCAEGRRTEGSIEIHDRRQKGQSFG